MADVQPRAVSWLWAGRLPMGRLSLLVGVPGAGKSYLTCDLAARVSTGTPWPDGSLCPRGDVLFITAEDDASDTIRPRLDACYADVARVHQLAAVRRVDDATGKPRDLMFTLADVAALEAAMRRLPDLRLVVIDPVGSFLGGSTDAHRDNEVRAVLAPLGMLAERYPNGQAKVARPRMATPDWAALTAPTTTISSPPAPYEALQGSNVLPKLPHAPSGGTTGSAESDAPATELLRRTVQ